MEESTRQSSRKKFLLWTTALLGAIPVLRLFSSPPKEKAKLVTMLTRDGKLVQIDRKHLGSNRTKAADQEVHDWMNPNPKS